MKRIFHITFRVVKLSLQDLNGLRQKDLHLGLLLVPRSLVQHWPQLYLDQNLVVICDQMVRYLSERRPRIEVNLARISFDLPSTWVKEESRRR